MKKQLSLFLLCLFPMFAIGEDYPTNWPAEQSVTHPTRRISAVVLDGKQINVKDNTKVYNRMLDQTFIVTKGQTVLPAFVYNGAWMNAYAYIDWGQDGQFDITNPNEDGTLELGNEFVSYSNYNCKNSAGQQFENGNNVVMPAFTIPSTISTGYYCMRFKLDWNSLDPAGSLAENNDLLKNGGAIVDIRLKVIDADDKTLVSAMSEHGLVVYHDGSPLDEFQYQAGKELPIMAYPEEGYKLSTIQVTHGNIGGDSLIHSVPQRLTSKYNYSKFNRGKFNIPEISIEGDVVIDATFEPLAENEDPEKLSWELTFFDEFDQPEGTSPDASKWSTSPKANSTWNRYVANNPEVAFQQNGNLVMRCIPAPMREDGSDEMISGAIQSKGKYSFKYGRVEARLKTTPHYGNFPAFWMMPEDRTGGWPTCGEIDIFESIDNKERAWHTIHSNWSYNLKNTNNPKSTSDESVTVSQWHTYALEWESQELRWYVDDKQVFSYKKSNDESILGQGQWPFDKEFYLILNQSVGNGSWAVKHDPNFTYETLFDWVRVYQLRPTHYIPTDVENILCKDNTQAEGVYDLSGRKIAETPTSAMQRGLYVYKGKKIVIK